jgi:hypothetical protein
VKKEGGGEESFGAEGLTEEEARSPCGGASKLKVGDVGCEVRRGTQTRESESEKTTRKEEKRRNLGFRASEIDFCTGKE